MRDDVVAAISLPRPVASCTADWRCPTPVAVSRGRLHVLVSKLGIERPQKGKKEEGMQAMS